MKQVANRDAILRIGKDEKWIDENDLAYETSESDGYALEEALRVKEAKGEGEVVVVSMGPRRVQTTIKDALARGADRAIHVVVEDINSMSPFRIAKCLAEAIRDENPTLVFSGLQSDDNGYGQTGVILAEMLNLPHGTLVIEIDRSSLSESIRIKRELESGWYQWFTYQMPALLTIQSGISQIRYAGLKGIINAKKKEIKEVVPSDLNHPYQQKTEKVYLPLKLKQTQILGGDDAKSGAVELIEKLKTEVRVL